jgi:hypothetical protein
MVLQLYPDNKNPGLIDDFTHVSLFALDYSLENQSRDEGS